MARRRTRRPEDQDTTQPSRPQAHAGETAEVDPSAVAVHAIDDDTRTHLRNPDETDQTMAGSGDLEHVKKKGSTDDAESGDDAGED